MTLPKLTKVITRPKKKKILLLSDDLRAHSGIATMSREFVVGTAHKYDWIQLGSVINHPDKGKLFDLSEEVNKIRGIDHANVRVMPYPTYGDPVVIRQLLIRENPDAILHFTDPRYWIWLYQMEHEIRQRCPLAYLNVWDDLPYPHWNEDYYESCDLIMNISRQTQNIVKQVLHRKPKEDWQVQCVPHGINSSIFKPLQPGEDPEYENFKTSFLKENDVDFIIFWNNRNARRKQPGDVVLAYRQFCDSLPKEKSRKCALLMHTDVVDREQGTDLKVVADTIAPEYKVIFSNKKITPKSMNYFYNIADVTLNIASNEGFGLSAAESIMAGTVILNNVTGGLQDTCRFEDDQGKWIEFTEDFPTNHTGRYRKCGVWAKYVLPSNRSLQGSVATPYIFDDRCDTKDVASQLRAWYDTPRDKRKEFGLKGREWMLSEESLMSSDSMCRKMEECLNNLFEKWKPRQRVEMIKVEKQEKNTKLGIIF